MIVENNLFGIFLNISPMFYSFQIFYFHQDWEHPEAHTAFVFLWIALPLGTELEAHFLFYKLLGLLVHDCYILVSLLMPLSERFLEETNIFLD